MSKEYCTKETCTYRRQVDVDKAYCMLPQCPFNARVVLAKNKAKSETREIISHYKKIGLIP